MTLNFGKLRKLNDERARGVLELRPAHREDYHHDAQDVAVSYDVSQSTILRIWRRQSYTHLEVPKPPEEIP